jgi:hypothetical protein
MIGGSAGKSISYKRVTPTGREKYLIAGGTDVALVKTIRKHRTAARQEGADQANELQADELEDLLFENNSIKIFKYLEDEFIRIQPLLTSRRENNNRE